MEQSDLRPADVDILDVLAEGRATKGMLVDATGYSRNTVYHRLEVLEAAGHVRCVHEPTRVFALVDDPRNSGPETDPVDAVAAEINIGRTDVAVEANRELVRVATRWLRDREGSVRKGAAPLAEWRGVDTHPQAPRSDKTLWNDVIVVAWRRSDLVADTPRSFEWVGE
jgi:DNA-binding transcriptional ArsR family regulator